ncbi:DNA mismatch repair endonuclease MutL [Paracrocinitomix mangrovi]|uniref:DNA mismatch repair endonuclease MutL n=1 Tax=Paracrocinitomix mangrovi TaxID=2862509 RepID=UPI001C8E0B4F|nr:DNA mismatch repair endonuclease MutL [Paracrocinitomix mangrovi]UKN01942.1 DNA mismatch repair endonuclease MutL [Paracrocinitomix mangrovi]
MSDVIKLLPSHIANQIAAGEVVQRPASVVKELIENSIDAGADKIDLVVKDGGKTLVQVIDNGCGMSDTDARMSFERHATSKIAKADDLFALQTKGFRGEALASIAAIAHVSLKTKLHDAELGTEIINEGSKIVSQEAVMCSNGTSIAVKNLFFNVPARRNFLGKNSTEYRKVLDEFLRIALVHPGLHFTFHHDGEEIYNLPPSNLRQRIVQLYGDAYNERLVPINEETDIVKIYGFITKPNYSKSKPDQSFLFVNNRFFKDRYFNHAIVNAYEGLIASNKYPPYFVYFDVPTQSIDVNVHPTKTEIKFEENQAIYAFLRSAIKQALGQFNVAPTLDFEHESTFTTPALKKGETVKMPEIKVNPDYNPFNTGSSASSSSTKSAGVSGDVKSNGFSQIQPNKQDWENFYGEIEEEKHNEVTVSSSMDVDDEEVLSGETKKPVQIKEKYIMSSVKNGFILIDQYRAHMRILYDDLLGVNDNIQVQQLLFEERMELEKHDLPMWKEIVESINDLGFDCELEGDVLVIKGQPAVAKDQNPVVLIQGIFDTYQHDEQDESVEIKTKLARSIAANAALKGGTVLTIEEMQYIIDALFASSSPQIAPNGKKIIETFTMDEITKRFN